MHLTELWHVVESLGLPLSRQGAGLAVIASDRKSYISSVNNMEHLCQKQGAADNSI